MIAHRSWSVMDMDSRKTLLVTRWRWYATWWAASLRIYDGKNIKIAHTAGASSPLGPRTYRVSSVE